MYALACQIHVFQIVTNFNRFLALKNIDEERYSLADRVLRKFKDPEAALTQIAYIVEMEKKLTRDYWLDFEQLSSLSPAAFCLITIVEWLAYEDWEGFNYALYFQLETVAFQIENQLLLPEIAATLRKARIIVVAQAESQNRILKSEGVLSPSPEFLEQADLFEEQRTLLINTLYEFVKKHIAEFGVADDYEPTC